MQVVSGERVWAIPRRCFVFESLNRSIRARVLEAPYPSPHGLVETYTSDAGFFDPLLHKVLTLSGALK